MLPETTLKPKMETNKYPKLQANKILLEELD